MKTKLCAALLLALALVPFAQTTQKKAAPASGFGDEDRAAIQSSGQAWQSAANAKDFESLASLYAQDAVLMPENAEAVQGRSAIRGFFEAFPPFSDVALHPVEIEGRDDLAYVRGTYSMKVTPPGATAAVEDRGKYLEIWRKQEDGSWKVSRDIFNSDLAAAE